MAQLPWIPVQEFSFRSICTACNFFLPTAVLAGIFFKITHPPTPSKVKWSAPKQKPYFEVYLLAITWLYKYTSLSLYLLNMTYICGSNHYKNSRPARANYRPQDKMTICEHRPLSLWKLLLLINIPSFHRDFQAPGIFPPATPPPSPAFNILCCTPSQNIISSSISRRL